MMAIIYQAVDIKPESLTVRTEACLMCILFDDGYMYQAVDIKPESLTVRTEACLNCVSSLMMVIMYQAVAVLPEKCLVYPVT